MYVGRIVAVGRTRRGANAGLYRVSSRSFPNRVAVELGGRLAIVPREGHERDVFRNPYIAYNCLRIARGVAIVSNGSHTDPIAEKVEAGMPVRDALAQVLACLDYERDDYQTPRIAGAVPLEGEEAWLAVVRADALVVRRVPLQPGRAWFVATYEADDVRDSQQLDFDAVDAPAAARSAVDGDGFAEFKNPVTAAAALAGRGCFELATYEVETGGAS